MRRFPGLKVRAFTLVEVLAALMLIAIVLPAVMRGITMSTRVAGAARHKTEASGLAQQKLMELVATGQYANGNLSGDFSPDWPDYKWEATTSAWSGDATGVALDQVDLKVTWTTSGREESVTMSTMTRSTQQ